MTLIKSTVPQRVTIKDIAARARVSIGTVDRVLHNRSEVNFETRTRILAIVEELGYTPNLNAKSLALKKSFHIAVLVPMAGEKDPYWKKPVRGFRLAADELKDFNTGITLYNYDLGEASTFITESERLLSDHPDGVIIAPHFHHAAIELVQKCKTGNIPVIFVDNNLECESCLAYFGQDAFQSGKAAAKLMNYHLNRNSKVLIVNLAPNKAITHHMKRREAGFIDFCNTEVPDRHITAISVAIDLLNEKELFTTLGKLLTEHPELSGIFVTNSRVHKVAGYLSSKGKGSIMLIGYDMVDDNNTYLEKGVIDMLICQKPEEQGYLSAMAMFNYLFTGKRADKVNFSPIDIIMKENLNYYNSNEAIHS